MTVTFTIRQIDPKNASPDEYVAYNAHKNQIEAERRPQEPPMPLEQTIRDAQNIPSFIDVRAWFAHGTTGDLLATADAGVARTQENKHLVQFNIEVLPEARRQGLASRLLELVAEFARAENRRLLLAETYATAPDGEKFMERLGAARGLVGRVNALDLATVDRNLLKRWQERARDRAAHYEIGMWLGVYPEQEMDEVVEMLESTNLAPRDDLDMQDWYWTREHVRQMEEAMTLRGVERWTVYARDMTTNEIAGFTEVYWNASKPDLVDQGWTAVPPKHRNRGLGRWLKAAMVERILQDRPEVHRIHTANADSNAAMLAINNEMGFKPYISTTFWQVELKQVEDYLSSRGYMATQAAAVLSRP